MRSALARRGIRRMGLGALAAMLVLTPSVWARPGVEESVARVKAIAKQLGETAGPSATERAALLEEAIGLRTEMIAVAPRDERAASWMLDQAEAVLQRAGWDGSEWAVLYGVPTAAQRLRVQDAASQAADLVERAAAAIGDAVERLEGELFAARGDPARASRVSAEIEPRLTVLLDVELAWRVPMLRSRAELLVIASEEGAVRSMERRAQAARVAAELDGLPTPDEEGDAARRVQLGTAYLLAGELHAAGERFGDAERMAEASASTLEQAALGHVASAMNLSAARELSKGVTASLETAPLLLALVRAEVAVRAILLQGSASASGQARAAVQRDALSPMTAVVRRVIEGGGQVPPAVRELVMQKVAVITGPGRAWGQIDDAAMDPPIVYARGMTMLGSEQGQRLLRAVATGTGDDGVRQEAMWALGMRAPEGDDERLDAASMLVRLAREFPESGRAGAALERADALLRQLMASGRGEVLTLQRELIELAWNARTDAGDRRELGSLAAANAALDANAAPDGPALERLLARLASWPEERQDRRRADERNVSIVVERALRGAADAAARAAIARGAAAWASRSGSDLAARFRLALAEALLETGDAKGSVEAVQSIGELDGAALNAAERVRARLTLGRAQRAAGEGAAAFATLRALADELENDPAGRASREPVFWAAWAEMLEILRSENDDGARSSTIRLQVNRLKLLDKSLGGEPWRARILAVEGSLK